MPKEGSAGSLVGLEEVLREVLGELEVGTDVSIDRSIMFTVGKGMIEKGMHGVYICKVGGQVCMHGHLISQ